MHKNGHKLKTLPSIKNPQFSSNLADIQSKLTTHEVVILTKCHKDCKKMLIFYLHKNFLFVPFFMHHPLLNIFYQWQAWRFCWRDWKGRRPKVVAAKVHFIQAHSCIFLKWVFRGSKERGGRVRVIGGVPWVQVAVLEK